MLKYTIRIIKPNRIGGREIVDIPLPRITEVLTTEEIFQMEMKLNEILHLRFHIESREES